MTEGRTYGAATTPAHAGVPGASRLQVAVRGDAVRGLAPGVELCQVPQRVRVARLQARESLACRAQHGQRDGAAGGAVRGSGGGLTGSPTPGTWLFSESVDLCLRHGVVPADLLPADLAGIDQLTKPLSTVARLPGCLSDQYQFLISHGADDIAPRQYPTTLGLLLLAFPNYNIGEGQ